VHDQGVFVPGRCIPIDAVNGIVRRTMWHCIDGKFSAAGELMYFRNLVLLVVSSLLLSGCQTTPRLGSVGRVEVYDVLKQRSDLQESQEVDEELEVYDTEIRDGRLLQVRCAIPDNSAYDGVRYWRGLVLIPKRGAAGPNDVIEIQRADIGGLGKKVFGFLSLAKNVPAQAWFGKRTNSGKPLSKDLLCDFDSSGLPARVVVDIPVQTWALDYSRAERARHRKFTDNDFKTGRVGLGRCSVRDTFGEVYYQPTWLFRVSEGISIKKGDVVELELGETESGGGIGKVSTMLKKLGERKDFSNDGFSAIFCK